VKKEAGGDSDGAERRPSFRAKFVPKEIALKLRVSPPKRRPPTNLLLTAEGRVNPKVKHLFFIYFVNFYLYQYIIR
jgi:hypothetical protein